MPKTRLDTDQQIQKLTTAQRLANEAARSRDLVRRLGALLLYTGIFDFMVVQAARLVEQVMLKGQLAEGKGPSFQPHADMYFYQYAVPARKILNGIRRLLPFQSLESADTREAEQVTRLAKEMVDSGLEFLKSRNPVIHQIGHPIRTLEDLAVLCDEANHSFRTFIKLHAAFFERAGRFRFSEKELQYFYGPKPT